MLVPLLESRILAAEHGAVNPDTRHAMSRPGTRNRAGPKTRPGPIPPRGNWKGNLTLDPIVRANVWWFFSGVCTIGRPPRLAAVGTRIAQYQN